MPLGFPGLGCAPGNFLFLILRILLTNPHYCVLLSIYRKKKIKVEGYLKFMLIPLWTWLSLKDFAQRNGASPQHSFQTLRPCPLKIKNIGQLSGTVEWAFSIASLVQTRSVLSASQGSPHDPHNQGTQRGTYSPKVIPPANDPAAIWPEQSGPKAQTLPLVHGPLMTGCGQCYETTPVSWRQGKGAGNT
jgi:hypothetical protein